MDDCVRVLVGHRQNGSGLLKTCVWIVDRVSLADPSLITKNVGSLPLPVCERRDDSLPNNSIMVTAADF